MGLSAHDQTFALRVDLKEITELSGVKKQAGAEPGVHKTGIRGIQDTRQVVDGKTNDIENNNKKGGSKPLS